MSSWRFAVVRSVAYYTERLGFVVGHFLWQTNDNTSLRSLLKPALNCRVLYVKECITPWVYAERSQTIHG